MAARKRFAAGMLAACASSVAARKYTGSANGDQWPYLGRFSFPKDSSGGIVGTAKMTYQYASGATQTAQLYTFDDDLWAQVYPSSAGALTCNAAINKWPAPSSGFATTPMQPGQAPGPAVISFTENLRPHVWFFTVAVPSDCSQGVQLSSWTLELTQADGNQLGYDEIGMPSIYGVFWAFYALVLAAHVYYHYIRGPRFAPAMVLWFTASLALVDLSYFCKMIDWATVSANGVGAPAMSWIGDILRIGSLMALWVVCAMAATGYGIVTFKLDEKNYNWVGWLLLFSMLIGYLTLIIYFGVDLDPKATVSFGSVWPAGTLLFITICYAAWWAWKMRQTFLSEVSTTKKAVLRRLAIALGFNFFVLPFAYIVGAATPLYERTRVTTGLDIFIITCINLGTMYALWPSNAADAFRVYDGSAASGMLAGLAGSESLGTDMGADFNNALDEAYAYSSMGAPGEKQPAV